MAAENDGITAALRAWSTEQDEAAREQITARIEVELRQVARTMLRRESSRQTLQTLDLVNEAYLRLIDQHKTSWQNRAHFFAIAARIMRRVLLDRARRRQAARRGDGAAPVTLNEQIAGADLTTVDPAMSLILHDALHRLEEMAPRQGRIVELRVFAGMTIHETAAALAISPATVKREWEVARAWLHRELTRND